MSAPDADLRAALERLADEWEHPAEVYALRMSAAPRIRALLAEHQPTAREANRATGAIVPERQRCICGDICLDHCRACNHSGRDLEEPCIADPDWEPDDDDLTRRTQPAPVAPAGEVRLTEAERQHLADWVLGGSSPSPLMTSAVERILAARLAAAEQRVVEAQAATWVGWELKVQELTDRAELAEQRVAAVRRLLRFEYVSAVDLAAALEGDDRG